MVKVRIVAALLTVVLGGLMATGAALAGRPDASEARPGKAAFCKRLDAMIEKKENAGNRLEKVAARIQARIDSGDLTDAQKARAEKHLARVQALIAKLDARVARLQAAFEKHCTA
jgi:division protein CdvB (Snf7/Vps24/ESCRT-III family)